MIDIIVIGGGIAGISVAARLSHGCSVLLLEQESSLGYHASGRSAASCIRDYGNRTTRELNELSFEYLRGANNGVLSDRGLMVLAKKNQQEEFKTSSKSFGLNDISLDEAVRKLPIIDKETVCYASYREDVYDLDANQLIQNFEREAKLNNAQVRKKTSVTNIKYINSEWVVTTSTGEYRSSIIVNAAGAWVDQISILAGIGSIGFSPFRRSMARIPLPDSLSVSLWPFFSGPDEDWYAKPDAGQLIVSPAEEDLVEPHDAWAEELTLAQGISRYEEFVTTPVTKMSSNWAGLRTFSPDKSLVIGPSVKNPTFFFMAGQGGYGFQTAPAASNLLSELIMGYSHDLDKNTIESLSPRRFN
jgi:D-arginine dehydrogenase